MAAFPVHEPFFSLAVCSFALASDDVESALTQLEAAAASLRQCQLLKRGKNFSRMFVVGENGEHPGCRFKVKIYDCDRLLIAECARHYGCSVSFGDAFSRLRELLAADGKLPSVFVQEARNRQRLHQR
jgi:hypothetical protein